MSNVSILPAHYFNIMESLAGPYNVIFCKDIHSKGNQHGRVVFITACRYKSLWFKSHSLNSLVGLKGLKHFMQTSTTFTTTCRSTWAEIHQPLLSHFSLLVEFFIGKVPVYNKDSRVLRLVNLSPCFQHSSGLSMPTSVQILLFYNFAFMRFYMILYAILFLKD